MSFTSFLDPILGPLMGIPAPWNILLLSFLLTVVITLVYKFATDQKMMKELKDEIKQIQKEMKEFKNYPDKIMDLQKRAWEKTMKQFMHSLKPTLITFIPILIIFGWMRTYYTSIGNPPVLFGLGWIWIYIVSSILFSILLRKLLKVH
ncbi:DUF106 domain-containing protein [Candidatus Woesearchaeota archaeon]|nr:DUF106 domain-containing protein [Candidatus Woesearchaeota archaeon]